MYLLPEDKLERVLVENLDLIESGLKLLKSQYNTGYVGCKLHIDEPIRHKYCKGKIDLLCLDSKGNLVIIEIKVNANANAVSQLSKYPYLTKEIFPLFPREHRKILCCIGKTRELKSLCDKSNIKLVPLDYTIITKLWNNIQATEKHYSHYYHYFPDSADKLFKNFCHSYCLSKEQRQAQFLAFQNLQKTQHNNLPYTLDTPSVLHKGYLSFLSSKIVQQKYQHFVLQRIGKQCD